jgi:hypothetical protein
VDGGFFHRPCFLDIVSVQSFSILDGELLAGNIDDSFFLKLGKRTALVEDADRMVCVGWYVPVNKTRHFSVLFACWPCGP